MNVDAKPYFLALTSSEKMALVSVLGEAMRRKEATQTFIDVSAGDDAPPVTVGLLFQLVVDLDPRRAETPEEELQWLRSWQREATRSLLNAGRLIAMADVERRVVSARLAWVVEKSARVVKVQIAPEEFHVYLPNRGESSGAGPTADAAIDAARAAVP